MGRTHQKSVRKVAVSIGNTTRRSRINTAESGFNSSLRGDFLRSRAVCATRTESVRVSSKSILQSIALREKFRETCAGRDVERHARASSSLGMLKKNE